MRILFLDIDSCRPDHLGCYGYHRNTSPNIDQIASQGVRFNNCYVPDAPCLPSRAAMMTGRFGIHSGIVDHAWDCAEPFSEGRARWFRSRYADSNWIASLRQAGLFCASVSAFSQRHSAFWFLANFNETYDTGHRGAETADQVSPLALDWLRRKAKTDNWFLHVQFWDPHTPYRVPEALGNPFANDPTPSWLTEEVRQEHWKGFGPECAQETGEFHATVDEIIPHPHSAFPRQPLTMDSEKAVRAMFDGYDGGIRNVDTHIGYLLDELRAQGVLEDTAIVITSDHGESLGENNVYMAHMTADNPVVRVPMIVRWPGLTHPNRVHEGLVYNLDVTSTVSGLLGQERNPLWDGRPFTDDFKRNAEHGREYLVCSNLAGSCQRTVRFDRYHYIRSYHDGYRPVPDVQLFDLATDYHLTRNLAESRPDLVWKAEHYLAEWQTEMMRTATYPSDPLWTVMNAGGAEHTRGYLPAYCKHLRNIKRTDAAEYLEKKHPSELIAK